MKNVVVLVALAVALVSASGGCESTPSSTEMPATGFLSDYSRLESISATSYRYINPKYSLKDYSAFIIEPVEIRFDDRTKAEVGSWDELEQLRAYMRQAFIDALEPRYTAVAARPGPRTARIRIALTNVKRSAPLKLGGATMEIELLDSQILEQIGALIESQEKGEPFHGYDPWSGAKAVMDDWAQRFYNRLEEARGR